MKKLFVVLVAILFPALAWAGPYLACDLPEEGVTITQTWVEVAYNPGLPGETVQTVPGLTEIRDDGFLLLDLGGLPPGKYRFRAWWAETPALPSDPSESLDVRKVGKPGNIKIK